LLRETALPDYDVLSNLRHVDLPNGTAIDHLIYGQNRRTGKQERRAETTR
jgi:hypothetical protein